MHSFDLDFANNLGGGIYPRQLLAFDQSTTLSLTNDFSQDLFSEDIGEVTVSAACIDCTTEGGIVVSVHVRVSLGNITEFTVSVSPKDFIATIELQTTIEATLGIPYNWRQKIGSVELGGLTIADILTLDSVLDYYTGVSISAWQSFSAATFGTVATLSNTAFAKVDLLDIKNSNFSGWAPTFEPLPASISTRLSGDMVFYSEPVLSLRLTVLGNIHLYIYIQKGSLVLSSYYMAGIVFDVEMDFKLPEAKVHLEGFAGKST
jgi:hypothetical protein